MPAPAAYIRDLVERARLDRGTWAEAAYQPAESADGEQIDHGSRVRAALLAGLGYDRRDDDLELCRFLLEHEVQCAEDADLQGMDDSLRLACFLVARARDPSDIWLLARAKLANFDTGCGLDREYLYAAGVERVVSFVRASTHPDRERVLAELFDVNGEHWFDDDELATWWTHVNEYFPASPDDDHPLSVVATTLWFGTRAEALPWLEKWASAKRDDDPDRGWARELATKIAEDATLRERISALAI